MNLPDGIEWEWGSIVAAVKCTRCGAGEIVFQDDAGGAVKACACDPPRRLVFYPEIREQFPDDLQLDTDHANCCGSCGAVVSPSSDSGREYADGCHIGCPEHEEQYARA